MQQPLMDERGESTRDRQTDGQPAANSQTAVEKRLESRTGRGESSERESERESSDSTRERESEWASKSVEMIGW